MILEFQYISFTWYSYKQQKFTYDKFKIAKFGFNIFDELDKLRWKEILFINPTT